MEGYNSDGETYSFHNKKTMSRDKFNNDLKYEAVNEIGVHTCADGYWGGRAQSECRHIGGHSLRRLLDTMENNNLRG